MSLRIIEAKNILAGEIFQIKTCIELGGL